MAKIRTLQILRGTTVQNDAYTGSAGELTMDTTTNELRLHDGSTAGGHVIGSGGGGAAYHPDLFSWQWADHEINDMQWLRADTFSWQDGAVYESAYQHLADDLGIAQQFYAWTSTYVPIVYGTLSETPSVGDKVYIIYNGTVTDSGSTVSGVVSSSIITIGSYNFERTPAEDTIATVMPAPQTETITGTTITYYTAPDGHKIVLADQESNVAAIYAATGVAWYYILDTVNQRFKLPRRHSQQIVRSVKNADGSWYRLYADGWVEQGGLTTDDEYTTHNLLISMVDTNYILVVMNKVVGNYYSGILSMSTTGFIADPSVGSSTKSGMWQVSGQSAIDMSSFQNGEKYLYFYVGNFTQTALENTAGLNASLFNGKADLDFSNTSMIDYVVEKQDPNSGNNYTWYRKYASGWVEQGGLITNANTYALPVAMIDTNYYVNICWDGGKSNYFYAIDYQVRNLTTTTFYTTASRNGPNVQGRCWEVKGMAAN